MLGGLKRWAQILRRDLHATWLAARDPRVPWHAKAVALFVTAYAFFAHRPDTGLRTRPGLSR